MYCQMQISEINPYIRLAMHSTLLAPSQMKRRIILDYELIYIESGTFRLNYNEHDYTCQKGDILLLCPNIPHAFYVFETTLVQPHIHFDMLYASDSSKVFVNFKDHNSLSPNERALIRENVFPSLQNASPILKIKNKEQFLKIFYEIVLVKQSDLLNTLEYKSKMLLLLQAVISENAPDDFVATPTILKIAPLVKAYIDSNYDQDIPLENLEQHFGYSKFYIEKRFKQEYGISPINYRNSKRLAKAALLLADHSVTATANKVGFSSIYAFSRAFRAFFGVSPTEYIRKSKEKSNESLT